MFNNFGFIGSKILKDAEEERKNLSHPYVGSEHLLLAILKNKSKTKEILEEYGLTYKKFRQELIDIVGIPKKNIDVNLYTPLLKRILSSALSDAKENNKGIVTESHLIVALLDEGEGIAIRIMIGMNINIDDLYDELRIKPQDIKKEKLEIFNIGRVLNDKVEEFDEVIGRDKEINEVIEVLDIYLKEEIQKKDVKRDTEKRGAVREHEKTQQYASVLDMSKQALELV